MDCFIDLEGRLELSSLEFISSYVWWLTSLSEFQQLPYQLLSFIFFSDLYERVLETVGIETHLLGGNGYRLWGFVLMDPSLICPMSLTLPLPWVPDNFQSYRICSLLLISLSTASSLLPQCIAALLLLIDGLVSLFQALAPISKIFHK